MFVLRQGPELHDHHQPTWYLLPLRRAAAGNIRPIDGRAIDGQRPLLRCPATIDRNRRARDLVRRWRTEESHSAAAKLRRRDKL